MTRLSCDEIADKLVDYADRELAEAESAEVAAHVACCDICRGQLAALHKSLKLAQTIWDDNATDLAAAGSQSAAQFTRPRVGWRLLRPAAAIAAAVALLVTIGVHQRMVRYDVPATVPHPVSPTADELKLHIERAGVAMQLLTAAVYPGSCSIGSPRKNAIQ